VINLKFFRKNIIISSTVIAILLAGIGLYALTESSTLYEQAMESFKNGNFRSAELLLRKVIDRDDDYKELARFYLARSAFEQKKYDSAIFEFNRFLLISSNNTMRSDSRFWIAESILKKGLVLESIEEYKRFLKENNGASDNRLIVVAYQRIAEVYLSQSRYDEAIIEIDKAYKQAEDKSLKNELKYILADTYYKNGKYDKSLQIIQELDNKDISQDLASRLNILLMKIYGITGKHDSVIAAFVSIPKSEFSNKNTSEAYFIAALSYIALRDTSSAEKYLILFINQNKTSPDINRAKFQYAKLITVKNTNEAKKIFGQSYNSEEDIELKFQIGLELSGIYMSEENYVKAAEFLEKAAHFENFSEYKNVLFLLCESYINIGSYDKAFDILTLMSGKYSYDSDADKIIFLTAVMFYKKGNSEKFTENIKKLNTVYPFSIYRTEIDYYYAQNDYNADRMDKAEKLFRKYVQNTKHEKRFRAYRYLLGICKKRKDFPGAEKISSTLIAGFSNNIGLDKEISSYIEFLQINSKPSEKYKEFLSVNFTKSDNAAEIYKNEADRYYHLRDYNNAIIQYDNYFKVKGSGIDPYSYYQFIHSKYETGNYDYIINNIKIENFNKFDKKIALNIVFILGKSYYQKGDYVTAANIYTSISYMEFPPEENLTFIKILLKRGDPDKAKTILNKIPNDSKEYIEGLLNFGRHYAEKGQSGLAKEYFFQIIKTYPKNTMSDYAKIEIARAYIVDGDYATAVDKINEIKNNSLNNKKNALTGIIYLKKNDNRKVEEILNILTAAKESDPDVRDFLLASLEYYYGLNDINNLKKTGQAINENYKNDYDYYFFFLGKYYLEKKWNKSAYFNMYKIRKTDISYRNEVLFYLGLLSLHQYSNEDNAEYFWSYVKTDNMDSFAVYSKINLAVLFNKQGKKNYSKKVLEQILQSNITAEQKTSAQGLIDDYGY